MELTYIQNHKSVQPATLQSIGLAFAKKYSSVFKALRRVGIPYSGNWQTKGSSTVRENKLSQLAQIQEQLDELSQNVTLLNQHLSRQQPLMAEKEVSDSSEIGINRFRALQTEK